MIAISVVNHWAQLADSNAMRAPFFSPIDWKAPRIFRASVPTSFQDIPATSSQGLSQEDGVGIFFLPMIKFI